jgi:hypothetical protein
MGGKSLRRHGEDAVNKRTHPTAACGSANTFAAVACQDYGAIKPFPLESAAAIKAGSIFLAAEEFRKC